jgi:NADH-quinone oxidoreductase subunit L
MKYIWLIPLLPAFGAAVNGIVGVRRVFEEGRRRARLRHNARGARVSLVAFWQLLGLPGDARAYDVTVAQWLSAMPLQLHDGSIGTFSVPVGVPARSAVRDDDSDRHRHRHADSRLLDRLHGGRAARRVRAVLLLPEHVLLLHAHARPGKQLPGDVRGWEGVGLCSYLLIGYWYEKKSASDAGKKAFITNRVGDWGFVLGVFLIFSTFGTLDFRAVQNAAATMPVETAQFGVLSAICLLLFVGATGKSAQIPLYVWLPDAMEGPTPVSALIHAATMVTAGVYMVGRNAVLFGHAPMVLEVVAIVGVLTALMAASIGLVQYDIKRVLAYSTVSQLGYMFTAMGVGAYAAGAFHLMTHAFFKALLFLGSGSVIHAMAGEQDMRRMGGLRKYLPKTYATMMIGTIAIAGIPPFAGSSARTRSCFGRSCTTS